MILCQINLLKYNPKIWGYIEQYPNELHRYDEEKVILMLRYFLVKYEVNLPAFGLDDMRVLGLKGLKRATTP